jgi:DNA-binding NarL/FixJ family response regulator
VDGDDVEADGAAGARILVCDEQPLWRMGFRTLLETESGLHVVGEVGDGDDAVAASSRLCPDLVVVDSDLAAADITRRLARPAHGRRVPVLVLAQEEPDESVVDVLSAGATGVLHKHVPPHELVDAVRRVAAGDAVLTAPAAQHLFDRLTGPAPQPDDPLPGLTPRERDVLELIAAGAANQDIASELGLSRTTVKSHVSHILTKNGLRDRAQAVRLAYESGLVTPAYLSR